MWPILAGIGGLLKVILPQAKDVGTVIFGDQSKRDATNAEADKAAQEAFGKEFTYAVGKDRRPFDVFMDGVNRLPRPIIALGIIALFIWTCIEPERASKAFVAMALIPEAFWNIAMMVVAFFFTSRIIEKLRFGRYTVSDEAKALAKKAVTASHVASPRAATEVIGLASTGNDLLRMAGFGNGALTSSGFTGELPPSRKAGWTNPIAARYRVET
jgi:hypothetical protein